MSVFNDTSHQSGSVPPSGGGMSENKKFSYGYSSLRGKRASMEDFHDAKIHKIEDKMVGLFGVFDGHGGSRAADYVQQNLFKNLLEHPQFVTDTKLAIAETYQSTDQAYLQAENNQHRDAGSTASTAVLVEDRLYVANVGDSRAVVCIGGIGHGGSRAAGYVQQKFLLEPQALFPSNPNVAIDETSKQDYRDVESDDFRRSSTARVEVFDSVTSGACDVPGPAFGLNEHQGGVFVDERVLFIAFLESGGRVVVGFDGKWVTWTIVKTSGHGDSPAADYAKQVRSTISRLLGAMNIPPKILFAFGVLCNLLQPGNAQQVTGSSNPVDPAAWLTIDTAKVASVTALFAGGLGAAFIWRRFFRRPPTFSVDAVLEASPAELGLRRSGLDSIYPGIDEC